MPNRKDGQPRQTAGEWMPAFLAALRNSANVRAACNAAAVSRKTVYEWRGKDTAAGRAFKVAWDEAMEEALDLLEGEAWKRAKAKSDTLLIFLLKGGRPEKYMERREVSHSLSREAKREIERLAAENGLTYEEALAEAEQILGKLR